jgi:hypothetical protein
MNDVILTAVIGGAFGLVCAVIGVCGTLYVTASTTRIEERRHIRELGLKERQHYRELGLKVALVNFEHCSALAQSAADKYHEVFRVPPLKGFIIQGIKLMEIISDPNLSADEMARKIAASEDFAQTIIRDTKQKQ